MTDKTLALLILLSFACMSCASSPAPTAPRIAPSTFWGGNDGAECMAKVFRALAPSMRARARSFQDFDVVFSVVEYELRGFGRVRIVVIPTSEMLVRWTAFPHGNALALSQRHRYAFELLWDTHGVPAFVLSDWEKTCDSVEAKLSYEIPQYPINVY